MKLLFTVEFYEPSKGGAQEVVRQLSERLARRGHAVTVATSSDPRRKEHVLNGVVVRGFDVRGNGVKGIRGAGEEYLRFIRESDFDVMLNYAAQTWTTDLVLPELGRMRLKKILAPLGYSRLHHRRYHDYFRHLPRCLADYDRLVYTSARYQDKLFGDAHGLESKAVIIPNGASREEFEQVSVGFKRRYGIETPYLFLTVSNHYLEKGHLFVLKAFRRFQRKDCTLVVIGERPHRHGWYSCYPLCKMNERLDGRVMLLSGVSRGDVVAAYHEADLFLFGSKVECAPLVMYESFASQTPFVTTAVGNVRDHEAHVRVVQTPEHMRSEMEEFTRDPERHRVLARQAHQVFLEHHSWERIAEMYERLFLGLVTDGPTRSAISGHDSQEPAQK